MATAIVASSLEINSRIASAVSSKADSASLATVAFTGSYGSLSGVPSTFPPTIGSTSTTAVAGNDARLTDTRVPTDNSVTNAKVSSSAAISADKLVDGTTNKLLTATERTKLSGIATGATANSSDATLLSRANHTGTQTSSTISDFSTAVDARISAGATTTVSTPLVERVRLGNYWQTTNNVYNFDQREKTLGRTFDIYSCFISFDSAVSTHTEMTTAAQTHDLLVAFQPQKTTGMTFANFLTGSYDAKIDEWATYLAGLPCRVYIRFGHEMNGSWAHYNPLYPSGSTDSSHCTSAAQFAQVWQYVYNRFKTTNNAQNCYFLFCPNGNDSPNQTGNHAEDFWPGASYVDVLGHDTYNALSGSYLSPDDTILGNASPTQGKMYDRLTALHSTAEVWVCETGVVDLSDPADTGNLATGHVKAQWYNDLARSKAGPRLGAIVFFDQSGTRNWVIDTTTAALSGWKSAFRVQDRPVYDTTGRVRVNDYSSWVAEAYDPVAITVASTPTSGTCYVSMIKLEAETSLTKLYVFMNGGATTPTTGQNFAGIYDSAGNQLAITADISSLLSTSSNYRSWNLASPTATLAAGTILYVALLFNAATPPSLGSANVLNGVSTNIQKRGGSIGTGLTALPASFSPGSVTGVSKQYWVAAQ